MMAVARDGHTDLPQLVSREGHAAGAEKTRDQEAESGLFERKTTDAGG